MLTHAQRVIPSSDVSQSPFCWIPKKAADIEIVVIASGCSRDRVWIAESALQHELCVSHFLTTECDAYEMSFICLLGQVTFQSPSHPHRHVLVHIEESSMMFQDCHAIEQSYAQCSMYRYVLC